MNIDILPSNDSNNGWSQILPDRVPSAAVTGDVTADWLVVGAGLTGLAAARRLAENRPSEHIVILEAGVCGENASGKNSGFATDLPHVHSQKPAIVAKDDAYIRLSRSGIASLEKQVTEHRLDCDWRTDGKYETAITDKGREEDLVHYAKALEARGESHRWVEADELRTVLGTDYFKHAVYTPGCALMNPAAMTRGLADTLPDNVQLYENSPITSIDYASGVHARCERGDVKARKMILAANGFSDQFGFAQRRFVHLAAHCSMSRPLNKAELATYGVEQPWGLTPINSLGAATMRFTPDRRLLIRQQIDVNTSRSVSAQRQALIADQHKSIFDSRFPMLPDVTMEHTWTGFICLSGNDAPAWGKVDSNVWLAACHNGMGVAIGTASGTLIADHATQRDNPLIEDIELLGTPSFVPPGILREICAHVAVAWHRYIGRDEI